MSSIPDYLPEQGKDRKPFLTPEFPLLYALVKNRFPSLSDEAALFATAEYLHVPYSGLGGYEELATLEFSIFNLVNEKEATYESTEQLVHLFSGGDIELVQKCLFAQSEEVFSTGDEIFLRNELLLYINGEIVTHPLSGSKTEKIRDAMLIGFSNLLEEDLKKLGYMERLKRVFRAFHSLMENPNDSFAEVLGQARAACPEHSLNSHWTPEHIGRCYVRYLKQCQEEGRDDLHVMSLSNYIKSRRWKKTDPDARPLINLTGLPEHGRIVTFFEGFRDAEDEIPENNDRKRSETDDEEEGSTVD